MAWSGVLFALETLLILVHFWAELYGFKLVVWLHIYNSREIMLLPSEDYVYNCHEIVSVQFTATLQVAENLTLYSLIDLGWAAYLDKEVLDR
jgi:hypothetical protein